MLALVKTKKGEGNMELIDRPIPSYGDDEVLIRVAYGGICGTDIHIVHDQFAYYPPVIIGHEFSGEIVELGSKVTSFKKGVNRNSSPLPLTPCNIIPRQNIYLSQDPHPL